MPTDMQTAIMAELLGRLGGLPTFGALVFEDAVLRVLDAEDEGLPDDFIVIQPGITEELDRVGPGSVIERATFNITAITRQRAFALALRAARLDIKCALAGRNGALATPGIRQLSFQTETPMLPGEGRRWACHVMPVQITYVQALT